MKKNRELYGQHTMEQASAAQSVRPRTTLWVSVAATLAALAWMAAKQPMQRTRRHQDRGQERRNPMHFFLSGSYPGRRSIDRSGARPLFERRQSVYDSY